MDLTRFGANNRDDLFLTQAAYKVEQDLEHYEDVMLSQVTDYLEKDYSLQQTMQSYLPITGDFDLLDVNFDLGYLLSAEQLPHESERVDIKPTEGCFPVVSDIEMQQLVHNQKKQKHGPKYKMGDRSIQFLESRKKSEHPRIVRNGRRNHELLVESVCA